MKTLNEYRKTNSINITGTDLNQMITVHTWAKANKYSIIGIANNNLHSYTVRVDSVMKVEDLLIEIHGNRCEVVDRVTILNISSIN